MMDATIALLQTVATALACAGLYLLWRKVAAEGIAVWIVGVGFAARAVGAAILFWVSWLELPLGRSLHLGNGLWFFAVDGGGYFGAADRLLANGVWGVFTPNESDPAHLYVQLIAVSRAVFGSAISVALLINLAAFLGTALVIARWGHRIDKPRAAMIPLAGLSLSPSLMLWSTQPLKDTLFAFLVVNFAFFVACALEADPKRRPSLVRVAIAMVVLMYLLGGVRWQYGVVFLVLLVSTLLWSGLLAGKARMKPVLALLGVAVLAGLVLVERLPGTFVSSLNWLLRLPVSASKTLSKQKTDFIVKYEPSTTIEAGPLLDWLPHSEVAARGVLMIVPRSLADTLGLATAHGGRGLWLFVEIDTLFLVSLFIVIGWYVWSNRPLQLLRNPLLGFLAGMLLAFLPTLYVVNNFGSLFRFRLMILLPVMLLPFAMPDRGRLPEPEPRE